MILVDANLLIYAHVASAPQHDRARRWLDEQLDGPARVGLPWMCLLAFLRIVTNPRIYPRAERISDAWRQVSEWLALDTVWIPAPTERHARVLEQLLDVSGAHGNLVYDAHLAALAMEHGLVLCSADTDFARFPQLRWFNPLTGRGSPA
ncbi:MAG TPA: type II toxin-antitoxin system VapC family toxin [Rhizomicrobium sp.]|nr:type II toxin-antitoxin system VapC family toxin [Rhizomicrobium sp.]